MDITINGHGTYPGQRMELAAKHGTPVSDGVYLGVYPAAQGPGAGMVAPLGLADVDGLAEWLGSDGAQEHALATPETWTRTTKTTIITATRGAGLITMEIRWRVGKGAQRIDLTDADAAQARGWLGEWATARRAVTGWDALPTRAQRARAEFAYRVLGDAAVRFGHALAAVSYGEGVALPALDLTVPPPNASALQAARDAVDATVYDSNEGRAQEWRDVRSQPGAHQDRVLAAHDIACLWRSLLGQAALTMTGASPGLVKDATMVEARVRDLLTA